MAGWEEPRAWAIHGRNEFDRRRERTRMETTGIDRILARELGSLGGFGAALVARLLPLDIGSASLDVELPPSKAAHAVERVLAEFGTPISCAAPELRDARCVIVGSGYMRLNPAIVCVWITSATAGGSSILVRGAAKEGLVKQRGGQQAARDIEERLRNAFASPPGSRP